ncbi:MAG: FAD-dependent oxidoreductase [Pseudomonadota bacterium]
MARTRVVLVGGGHAHALVLHEWAERGRPDAEVTLISPEAHSPYSGMLPGHVAGHYDWGAFHVDLAGLAARAGVRRLQDRVVGLDLANRDAHLASGGRLAFDLLALDTGSTSNLPALPGSGEHVVPIKPLGPFLARWNAFLAGPAQHAHPPEIVVLGGGLGGIELVLAIAHRLRTLRRGRPAARITLVERASRLAPTLAPRLGARLRHLVEQAGIEVRLGRSATRLAADHVELEEGIQLSSDLVVAAVGARPAAWLASSGLALTTEGFVRVDERLASISHPAILAAGDVAHLEANPREKAGVFAVRQGPVLARILEARLSGEAGPTFRPQRDYLRLVSLGDRRALALKYGMMVGGPGVLGALLWRLKDRIDRRFMTTVGAVGT